MTMIHEEKKWLGEWRELAEKTQEPMQFFINKKTLWMGEVVTVDPDCPCQPAHETWAHIERVSDNKVWVYQPVVFRVLFWYDSQGVQNEDGNPKAPRFDYRTSVGTTGFSWDHLPEENGEYLCTFVKRATILPLEKIGTMSDAYHRTLHFKKVMSE